MENLREGCSKAHPNIKANINEFDPRVKAREVVQVQLRREGRQELATPKWTDEKPPEEPNTYSDGSVHNPRSTAWQIGGVGIWWPGRKLEAQPLTEDEAKFMHVEQTDLGVRGWNAFNDLKNSSTRTEIGASLLAMLQRWAVNIGIAWQRSKKGPPSSTTKGGERRRR